MKTNQLSHAEITNNTNTKEIVVIAEDIRSPENIGMIFRISEAFGVKNIYLIGDDINLKSRKILKTARSTDKLISIKTLPEISPLLDSLKSDDFFIIGLEITNNSKNLKSYDFNKHNKIAIIVGTESHGVAHETLQKVDDVVHIEMFGQNSSINVVNALGICLYQVK